MSESRAKVLHVITHLDGGGAQDNTLLTVEHLDRARYTVDLAAGPGALEDRARRVADHVQILDSLHRPLFAPGTIRTFLQLRRACAGYDVVHTHGSKGGVLGRLAARSQRVPVVVHTIHGLPVTPTMSRPLRRLLLAVERTAARCADRIVCVCQTNATEALELGITTPAQTRVVVSGVDDAALTQGDGARIRQELGIAANAPVVGSVTRLMEQKAPLDLVAAAHEIVAARPDAHMLIVGDGPMRDEVTAAVGGHDRIHVMGQRADVADVLAAIDVVVFSSLWEGLGRALTEAVLVGKPVVATAVNGVPELVEDGVSGFLVPSGEPRILAGRTLDLLDLPDRGRSWGAAGAARISGRYDVRRMVAGVDDVYAECLTGPARQTVGV